MVTRRSGGDYLVFRNMTSMSPLLLMRVSVRCMFTVLRDGWLFPTLGCITYAVQTSAFRFVYPTLIVAAYDHAYLWDIPSGRLIQTIEECQLIALEDGNNHLLGIKYVEISERHVFITGQFYLRVFSRATGKSVLNFSSSSPGGLWRYTARILYNQTPGSALVRYGIESTQEPYEFRRESVQNNVCCWYVTIIRLHFNISLTHGKKCMSLRADVTLQLFLILAAFWSYTILKKRPMRKIFTVKHWTFRLRNSDHWIMDSLSRPSTWPLITEEYQWLL